MEQFDFFFSLHLGERHYSHTDYLPVSKDLQWTAPGKFNLKYPLVITALSIFMLMFPT